jgi:RNAse (barnase) inhibitor barstar
MKRITLDISDCKTADDLYSVLLLAFEAPDWHGRNLDALDVLEGGMMSVFFSFG